MTSSFENTLKRLEQIANSLDRDDIPLEDALVLFEEGIAKLREATTALAEAEGKVQTLIEQSQGVFEVRE
ncbi:MAG TPA: exodeoxyribonuclease VII small subunit [Gemmatimonadaceae bacterium]|jgi:exodeoxyribonuclease VII small subunit|nr:exodeoxyribonuclease VII small subunit [Gemmatimonadaceae bacterium]